MQTSVWTFLGEPTRRRLLYQLLLKLEAEENLKIRDTVNLYPDFFIDAEMEKEFLLQSRGIVLLHPWVSFGPPAMTKEWMDRVLHRRFAWGDSHHQLKGRHWIHIISMGGAHPRTESPMDVELFLASYRRMVEFCGMHWHPPILLKEPSRGVADTHVKDQAEEVISRFRAVQEGWK